MTQEQKQEFTRRISQENHSGLILVLCDIFHTYGVDAMAAYEAENTGHCSVYMMKMAF